MLKFIQSIGLSWSGIRLALRTEPHMRFHLISAIIVTTVSLLLGLNRLEWIVLILAMAMVIALELLNTAIENVVDLVSPERHPLAKAAKDTAAGAVLAAAIAAAIIGLLILGPHLMDVIRRF
ncbi:diacylglycerol kinase family protein [Paenibacillus solisilvae]|uniref:Diacylglycerol kinase family protein n=1 Tax=Paenibacillus solisilvae TaxID=2486751 RepID=A0ABW0W3A7_9BACL